MTTTTRPYHVTEHGHVVARCATYRAAQTAVARRIASDVEGRVLTIKHPDGGRTACRNNGLTIDYTTATPENRGMLPVGTNLDGHGVITHVSISAYHVEYPGVGRAWQSFDQVHGRPAPVAPLVVFG